MTQTTRRELVTELQAQFHATMKMYDRVLENCTEEIWLQPFRGAAYLTFWREAYHLNFWLSNFIGDRTKRFEMMPFGKDIDPRTFTAPNSMCSLAEAKAFSALTRQRIDQVFDKMTVDDLSESDEYDESDFRSVFHRLIYGMRHAQYHIGRLTAYLDQEGVAIDNWDG